jgi:ATP-dependent DNA helicase RecG
MTRLERQLKEGESQALEFVESAKSIERLASHVAALLNSGGGKVIVGVNEEGVPLEQFTLSQSTERLEREMRRRITPSALFSVSSEPAFESKVLVIDVPGGREVPFVVDGKVYLRKGSQTSAATGEELHQLFQSKEPEVERWERRKSPVLTFDELDEKELKKTLQTAQQSQGRFAFDRAEDEEALLQHLGMLSQGQLTNAADVCLGAHPAMRHAQVRLQLYAFQSDRRGDYLDEADISAPVVKAVEAASKFIKRNTPLAAEFLPDRMERRNVAAYPEFAIREGLVNALAHRDYSHFSSSASVLVFPDRLEIWNSGSLPDGWRADRLRHEHPSIPNNPDVAQFLYLRKFMERVGRGTMKMIQACREAGMPAPRWRADSDGVTLTLFSNASQSSPAAQLNERQEKLLAALGEGEVIRIGDYAEGFAQEVSQRQARRDLKELEAADLLRLEGKGRASHYLRTQRPWPSKS